MNSFGRFPYPFRYVPHPQIVDEAEKLIAEIKADPFLKSLFQEGKMLGVLICENEEGERVVLKGFSGLVKGRSQVPGFVPPIFDTTLLPRLWSRELSSEESAALQNELFDSYIVLNARGERLSIKEVFARKGLVPPGGTGECAAPKLLNYAYLNNLRPLSFGEFWFGAAPTSGEVREEGRFYPSCTGKCGPLLSFMLEGLDVEDNPLQRVPLQGNIEIIYEDEDILVANKPSGMLCAPGLTGTPSLLEILSEGHGKLYSCHRLDMDTSGLILYAKNPESQANLQGQFARREVEKTYLAHLCSGNKPWRGKRKGTIALPLAADYYDRPRQMVDFMQGKQAITEFEILEIFPDQEMDVRFYPKTGRTHQLRVHAASALGLGRPIKGDALYGAAQAGPLMLHAETLAFRHPRSGEKICFSTNKP